MDPGGCRVDQLWHIKSTHDKPFLRRHKWSYMLVSHSSPLFTSATYLFTASFIQSYMSSLFLYETNLATPVASSLVVLCRWWYSRYALQTQSSLMWGLHTQHNKTKQSPIICHFSLFQIESVTRYTIMCDPRPTPTVNNGECMWSWPPWT